MFLSRLKSKKSKHKKIGILAESKLNSVKSVILKLIQECYISEKYYVFINKEVDRCNKFKEGKKMKNQLRCFEIKMLTDYKYKNGVDEFV